MFKGPTLALALSFWPADQSATLVRMSEPHLCACAPMAVRSQLQTPWLELGAGGNHFWDTHFRLNPHAAVELPSKVGVVLLASMTKAGLSVANLANPF